MDWLFNRLEICWVISSRLLEAELHQNCSQLLGMVDNLPFKRGALTVHFGMILLVVMRVLMLLLGGHRVADLSAPNRRLVGLVPFTNAKKGNCCLFCGFQFKIVNEDLTLDNKRALDGNVIQ